MSYTIGDTRKQQERALDVLNALHAADFRDLWLESVVMFRGNAREGEVMNAQLRIIIEAHELTEEAMKTIYAVADEHDARVGLARVLGPTGPSRIAVWPRWKGED